MAQARNYLCLALETRQQLRFWFDVAMKYFDRDRTLEGEMLAKIDLCHAPTCKELLDLYFRN
jgi:hypothetical protein